MIYNNKERILTLNLNVLLLMIYLFCGNDGCVEGVGGCMWVGQLCLEKLKGTVENLSMQN